jgi:hypothetical protein
MGILPRHAERLSHSFVALVFPCNTTAIKATIGIITFHRVGTPAFHASKEEIAATHVAGTKVQRITGIPTTTKGRIPTIKLNFKATIETAHQKIHGTIAIGIRIRIIEIINNNSNNHEQASPQGRPSTTRRNITCFNCGPTEHTNTTSGVKRRYKLYTINK